MAVDIIVLINEHLCSFENYSLIPRVAFAESSTGSGGTSSGNQTLQVH